MIIIELTCLWREYESVVKAWRKVYPVCCSVSSNGWSFYFYAIEVGTQGFCVESVKICLCGLGFNKKLCRKTLQTFCVVLLPCSFEIWPCWNCKSWSLDQPVSMSNLELMQKTFDLNEVSAPKDHHSCSPVYSGLSPKTVKKHCGIINKGNTCYANVILQYNTISLSRHEQVCLSGLRFERYFSHHRAR